MHGKKYNRNSLELMIVRDQMVRRFYNHIVFFILKQWKSKWCKDRCHSHIIKEQMRTITVESMQKKDWMAEVATGKPMRMMQIKSLRRKKPAVVFIELIDCYSLYMSTHLTKKKIKR